MGKWIIKIIDRIRLQIWQIGYIPGVRSRTVIRTDDCKRDGTARRTDDFVCVSVQKSRTRNAVKSNLSAVDERYRSGERDRRHIG